MTVQLMGYMDNPLSESENQQRQKERAESIRQKKREQEYFIRQKFIGLSAVLCGITALHISSDSIVALLLIPFGITAMFSHKRVITEEE